MEGEEPPREQAAQSLHANFYRFLDDKGAVIRPPNSSDVGGLDDKTEAQLALSKLPDTQQIGYIRVGGRAIDEVIAVPLFSTGTGEIISALVIGFKPLEIENRDTGMSSGIWTNGRLHLPSLPASAQESLNRKLVAAVASSKLMKTTFESMWMAQRTFYFTSGSTPARSFRRLTRFAFTHWPLRWRNCIGFGGK
jgi:hypothetical protein